MKVQSQKTMALIFVFISTLIMNSSEQEFDIATQYASLKRTYTGRSCEQCFQEGRNHCLLSNYEGVCCDKGDPRCLDTALNYNDGRYCAEAANYDYLTSYLTCPTTQRCPQGNVELDLSEYGQKTGFSDSWSWYQYVYGSVCKFRVYSNRLKSNIILKISSVVGKAQVRVFIMNKDKFEYPQQTYDVVFGSTQTSFNISSSYFEYQVYVIPDTFTSGSYRIDVELEKAWQPAAFEPVPDDAADNQTGQSNGTITVTDPVSTLDSNGTQNGSASNETGAETANETESTAPTSSNLHGSAEASTVGPQAQIQDAGAVGVTQTTSTAELAIEIMTTMDSYEEAKKAQEEQEWDPSQVIKDKDSFLMLVIVGVVFCVLLCFMMCIGYWLCRHSQQSTKNIEQQQSILYHQQKDIKSILTEMESSSVNNSYLGAISQSPIYPYEQKEAGKLLVTPRSSNNIYGHYTGTRNSSAAYGHSTNLNGNTSTNVNGMSSRLVSNNNSGIQTSSYIKTTDGRIFRPIQIFKHSYEQQSSLGQRTMTQRDMVDLPIPASTRRQFRYNTSRNYLQKPYAEHRNTVDANPQYSNHQIRSQQTLRNQLSRLSQRNLPPHAFGTNLEYDASNGTQGEPAYNYGTAAAKGRGLAKRRQPLGAIDDEAPCQQQVNDNIYVRDCANSIIPEVRETYQTHPPSIGHPRPTKSSNQVAKELSQSQIFSENIDDHEASPAPGKKKLGTLITKQVTSKNLNVAQQDYFDDESWSNHGYNLKSIQVRNVHLKVPIDAGNNSNNKFSGPKQANINDIELKIVEDDIGPGTSSRDIMSNYPIEKRSALKPEIQHQQAYGTYQKSLSGDGFQFTQPIHPRKPVTTIQDSKNNSNQTSKQMNPMNQITEQSDQTNNRSSFNDEIKNINAVLKGSETTSSYAEYQKKRSKSLTKTNQVPPLNLPRLEGRDVRRVEGRINSNPDPLANKRKLQEMIRTTSKGSRDLSQDLGSLSSEERAVRPPEISSRAFHFIEQPQFLDYSPNDPRPGTKAMLIDDPSNQIESKLTISKGNVGKIRPPRIDSQSLDSSSTFQADKMLKSQQMSPKSIISRSNLSNKVKQKQQPTADNRKNENGAVATGKAQARHTETQHPETTQIPMQETSKATFGSRTLALNEEAGMDGKSPMLAPDKPLLALNGAAISQTDGITATEIETSQLKSESKDTQDKSSPSSPKKGPTQQGSQSKHLQNNFTKKKKGNKVKKFFTNIIKNIFDDDSKKEKEKQEAQKPEDMPIEQKPQAQLHAIEEVSQDQEDVLSQDNDAAGSSGSSSQGNQAVSQIQEVANQTKQTIGNESIDTKNKSQYHVYDDDENDERRGSIDRYQEQQYKFNSVVKLADHNFNEDSNPNEYIKEWNNKSLNNANEEMNPSRIKMVENIDVPSEKSEGQSLRVVSDPREQDAGEGTKPRKTILDQKSVQMFFSGNRGKIRQTNIVDNDSVRSPTQDALSISVYRASQLAPSDKFKSPMEKEPIDENINDDRSIATSNNRKRFEKSRSPYKQKPVKAKAEKLLAQQLAQADTHDAQQSDLAKFQTNQTALSSVQRKDPSTEPPREQEAKQIRQFAPGGRPRPGKPVNNTIVVIDESNTLEATFKQAAGYSLEQFQSNQMQKRESIKDIDEDDEGVFSERKQTGEVDDEDAKVGLRVQGSPFAIK